jgi:DNA-binding transcriptional regulator GbsR (MarR family)
MKATTTMEIQRLQSTHATLKFELQSLSKRAHLTPAEQERARQIKKEKLLTKDRLRVLSMRAMPDPQG